MQFNYLIAAGLLPELIAAAAVPMRRDVSCSFSVGASAGDTCETFSGSWGISVDQFQKLNPDIQCPALDDSKSYCVIGTVTSPTGSAPTSTAKPTSTTAAPTSTTQAPTTTTSEAPTGPSPTMPGIVAECDQFYKIAPGDQCDTIEVKFGINDSDFKNNLWLDYYVCVHIPGARTTAPGVPTPTNSGPTPQMPGVVADCKTFYKVASGDGCDKIGTKYNVSLAQLRSWNTQIDATCTNLWLDYYICVGV
ncbi:hypothetical protein VE02_09821 [Pseudogymnoascus sp. 03VT05]|nr:hypothetical protein VE02_09821 [Pseudogymnoascus sp. 03VT05]